MRAIETIVTNFSGAFPNALGINSTGPSTKDGTELIANLFNDYIGVFPQALLNHMAVTPNGNAETAANCQQIDVIIRMMARYGSAHGCIGAPDTDTLHDVQISRGMVPDSTFTYSLFRSSAIAKQGDVAWVAGGTPGTPAGGLMGGTWSANTEYGIFLIYNPTTKVVDAGFSVYTMVAGIATPTFLPAGYTVYQLVDWVKTDGSSQIIQMTRIDLGAGMVRYSRASKAADATLSNTVGAASRTLTALTVPTGFKCPVNLIISSADAASGFALYFTDPSDTDEAVGNKFDAFAASAGVDNGHGEVNINTNTARQIGIRATITTVDSVIVTTRYFDLKRF